METVYDCKGETNINTKDLTNEGFSKTSLLLNVNFKYRNESVWEQIND